MSLSSPPLELLNMVKERLLQRSETLSLGESCTGGLLSFWLTYLPGSSHYFKGAMVAYDTTAKIQSLNVKENTIKDKGLVSEETAREMAQGVNQLFLSDWGLSTTGWTGPEKGNPSQPVGTVCFALCSKFAKKSCMEYFKEEKRQDIQFQASLFALKFFLSVLNSKNP